MEMRYVVRAEFDREAKVWVAEGQNFDGLVTEAATLDELKAKLEVMVPEILELNGLIPSSAGGDEDVPFDLLAAAHGQRCHV